MALSSEASAGSDAEKQVWSHHHEEGHDHDHDHGHDNDLDHDGPVVQLEQYRKDYLMERHGTLDLEPMPSNDPQDPLNWPNIKKNVHLLLVAFNCMMAYFQAAGIIPAFEPMAIQYGKSLSTISYLTTIQILLLGLSPIFIVPLMNKYGRRPFLLISTLGAMAANIGGGFCTTYGAQMATRALASFFISPACAIGSVVVTEIYFSKERGRKVGWWALMGTLGSPSGPFIMGFVQQHAGTKWIYFTLAITDFCIFIGYLFFGPETLYNRLAAISDEKTSLFKFKIHDSKKITLQSIFKPFAICTQIAVIIPLLSQSFVFVYANVALIVEMPQVFIPKFGLDPQQMALQFIAIIIGSLIGEQAAGPLSDWWMAKKIKSRGKKVIEDRLWLSYPGYITIMVGLIVWGCLIQNAVTYTVTPLIGAGIASFGNQLITTILITFAVDVNPSQSSAVGLVVNFTRAVWAFIGPFYFPHMFDNLGFAGSGGLMAGLVVVVGGVPVAVLHFVRRHKQKKAA